MNQPRPPARPPGRYGETKPRRRLALTAVVVVVVAALLSWLVWAALVASTPDVRSTLVGFRVVDDAQVRVRFQVVADRASAVTCTLTARDADGSTTGVQQVTVPAGRRDVRDGQTVIRTRARAVTADVAGCRLAGGD